MRIFLTRLHEESEEAGWGDKWGHSDLPKRKIGMSPFISPFPTICHDPSSDRPHRCPVPDPDPQLK